MAPVLNPSVFSEEVDGLDGELPDEELLLEDPPPPDDEALPELDDTLRGLQDEELLLEDLPPPPPPNGEALPELDNVAGVPSVLVGLPVPSVSVVGLPVLVVVVSTWVHGPPEGPVHPEKHEHARTSSLPACDIARTLCSFRAFPHRTYTMLF